MNGEMDNFHWHCASCKSTFPSLQNISEVLNEIKTTHHDRMTNIETRLSDIESGSKIEIKESITEMKQELLESLMGNIDSIVDSRNREMDNRRRRETNLVIFNLPEGSNATNIENKKDDETRISTISSSLGLDDLDITTSFRLGQSRPTVTRPLKIILAQKSQRKFFIENARFIPTKAPNEFRRVYVVKDLTLQQQQERKLSRMAKLAEAQNPRPYQAPPNPNMGSPEVLNTRSHPNINEDLSNQNMRSPEQQIRRTPSSVYVSPGFAFSQLSQVNRFANSQHGDMTAGTEQAGMLDDARGERSPNRSLIQEIEPESNSSHILM
ncbi:MAG: hypothetical protein ABW185_11005 [Sedimenticola sp.]